MSVIMIDYLPFDYITYTQQILPAIHHATEGNEVPLRTLLQSLDRISFGPRSMLPLPLSAEDLEQLLEGEPFYGSMRLEGLLDVATLRRVRAGEPLNPWQSLAKVIPFLKGRSLNRLGRYGEMLHFHLFYTLCTEPPPSSWTCGRPVLPHDEPVFDWTGYISRDEEMRTLWGMFEKTAPEAFPQDVTSEGTSRALSPTTLCRESITGFLTPEETQYLLKHVRTHERPWLESVISGCIRDGEGQGWEIDPNLFISDRKLLKKQQENDAQQEKYTLTGGVYQNAEGQFASYQTIVDYWKRVHPEEMKAFEDRYYQDLWRVEAEILQRMRLVVARGWGMLQTYYN
jgi:hypothetical protein